MKNGIAVLEDEMAEYCAREQKTEVSNRRKENMQVTVQESEMVWTTTLWPEAQEAAGMPSPRFPMLEG